jgi:ABC-type uncharacterized transport system substrate-binding protein
LSLRWEPARSPRRFRRTGIFVDKILKGAKPGDIPFGYQTQNELLARADKVIE